MKKIKVALACMAAFAFQYVVAAAPRVGNDIPSKVYSAFSRQYPAEKFGSWEMIGNNYIVDFINRKDQRSSAYYAADGAWLRTDTRLESKADLPEAVRNGLALSRYNGYYIDKMEKVQQPSNQTLYIVHVDYGANLDFDLHDIFANDYVLYFNSNGTLKDVIGRAE
jgi:Putative beta-lactamase-inhibitor-like, PepSY-like